VNPRRFKVTLQCKRCGEKFTLRGRKDREGNIETGFKQCICDNTNDFMIISDQL
jgi:hypothetical protein